jgi:hypothetical protein
MADNDVAFTVGVTATTLGTIDGGDVTSAHDVDAAHDINATNNMSTGVDQTVGRDAHIARDATVGRDLTVVGALKTTTLVVTSPPPTPPLSVPIYGATGLPAASPDGRLVFMPNALIASDGSIDNSAVGTAKTLAIAWGGVWWAV